MKAAAPFGKTKAIGALCLMAVTVFAGGSPGIRPRGSPADYPAHYGAAAFAIGAAVIPHGDVKKIFSVDLNGAGYLVVEVGVFPVDGREVDLSPAAFTLVSDGEKVAARPVDAGAIASVVGRKYDPPRVPGNSDVYVTEGVTIDRVPTIDPATGRRTNTTVAGTQTGVGIGAPPVNCRFNNCDGAPYPAPYPTSSAPRAGAVEQELWQKSLPDDKTTVAVAGYLYFPKPSGKAKNGPWQLIMDEAGGRVKLTLR
jgi:hypothetical protein